MIEKKPMTKLVCEKCQGLARAANQRGDSGAIFCDHNTEKMGVVFELFNTPGFEPRYRVTWPITAEGAEVFLSGLRREAATDKSDGSQTSH